MIAHLRANVLLLGLTFTTCSVLYPLAILAVGQVLFPSGASGSLVAGPDGKTVGSRLIAQEFKGDEWFHARPSAADYNAAASSGSNLGANNPKLRDRAARQLGPVVKYRAGTFSSTVQQDIETWLAATHPGTGPVVENGEVLPVTPGPADHAACFSMWLQGHPEKAKHIEPTPADAVTTASSGLDPHITLRNAKSQLDRVVTARVAKGKVDATQFRGTVEAILNDAAFEPLAGFAGGEPLVNILEVNLELARRIPPRP